jgi:hypothetical protein
VSVASGVGLRVSPGSLELVVGVAPGVEVFRVAAFLSIAAVKAEGTFFGQASALCDEHQSMYGPFLLSEADYIV